VEFGLVHSQRDIVAQSAYVYDQLTESLKAYGLDWRHVMHQTMYLCDAAEHASALNAYCAAAKTHLPPPTSIAPIVGASPFARNRLEVEVIASRVEPPDERS
jgi:enamine deaminase RidA (YjgF/YER057c/UK114 family)